jgi:hypothetical protein
VAVDSIVDAELEIDTSIDVKESRIDTYGAAMLFWFSFSSLEIRRSLKAVRRVVRPPAPISRRRWDIVWVSSSINCRKENQIGPRTYPSSDVFLVTSYTSKNP